MHGIGDTIKILATCFGFTYIQLQAMPTIHKADHFNTKVPLSPTADIHHRKTGAV
jgi:uncharacterized membrane protein YpjA